MKVVLFCGGLGTRLGGLTDDAPKPMVKIGYRPILWHVMKYYAHFGHKDFILCLGYKADTIKDYFLNYDETVSNNFTMTRAGREIELEGSDLDDWRITFVDTGLTANIGQRLAAVRPYLDGEEMFLANYSDGLTNLHLPSMIQWFRDSGKIASFLAVKPSQSFSVVTLRDDRSVEGIRYVRDTDLLINGGGFVLRKEIFHYLKEGEELVEAPFRRLIEENQLVAYRHEGWWCMDTFKEHQQLSDMYRDGNAPWEVLEDEQLGMLTLDLVRDPDAPLRVLALGAHCDDIEIGCGGTIIRLLSGCSNLHFDWVIFASDSTRAREAEASAEHFLRGAKEKRVVLKEFRNGYFPDQWARIKDEFEALKGEASPDLIFTHYQGDLHQDHRTIAELTWNTFRDHLILEYEVPKYDPDLASPNFFVPLEAAIATQKARSIVESFQSQRDKHWFTEDTFLGLMRLRGVQSAAKQAFAEAFYVRKLCAGVAARAQLDADA